MLRRCWATWTPVWTHLSFWKHWAESVCPHASPSPDCVSSGRRRLSGLQYSRETTWRGHPPVPEPQLHTERQHLQRWHMVSFLIYFNFGELQCWFPLWFQCPFQLFLKPDMATDSLAASMRRCWGYNSDDASCSFTLLMSLGWMKSNKLCPVSSNCEPKWHTSIYSPFIYVSLVFTIHVVLSNTHFVHFQVI